MDLPESLRNQEFDAITQQFGAGVAEKAFHLRIRPSDPPARVNHEDGIG